MQALQERLQLDYQRFGFVDVGSGKGRALLLASDYPFREIIGVELSPELDRVARANIARYHGGTSSTAGHLHAGGCGRVPLAAWTVDRLHVECIYRPVMERVFQNLEASLAQLPRELYLVYIHPELE